jgi:hypothetical protein
MDFLGGFAISYKLDGLFAKTPNARLCDTYAVECGEREKPQWLFISPIVSGALKSQVPLAHWLLPTSP